MRRSPIGEVAPDSDFRSSSIIESGTLVERMIEKAFQNAGVELGYAQFRILEAAAKVAGIQPTVLAGVLYQETHSVSGLLNRLEDRELIRRDRGKFDRRVVRVYLTPAGEDLLDEARQIVAEIDRALATIPRAQGEDELTVALYELAKSRGISYKGR